jgi:nucleoside-diphosphate-sugar epimerase
MPHAFVTGSNGFLGLHLVRALRAQGYEVTANYRPGTDPRALAELGANPTPADITDTQAITEAMPKKADVVFHTAGSVSFWKARNEEQSAINVDGTRNVVRAALSRRARQLVYTSSVAAFGPKSGDHLDEQSPLAGGQHWINYYRSKWLAEQELQQAQAAGLDTVIINPGNILGPGDSLHWGRVFVQASARHISATPPGSAAFCHVDDVVHAHLVAARVAPNGARYVLGSALATYQEFFELVHQCFGLATPPSVPAWVLRSYVQALNLATSLLGREPSITPEFAHVLNTRSTLNQDKAHRELGVKATPLEPMVLDTYRWLTETGSVAGAD